MVKYLKSEIDVFAATQNESHTVIYFSRNSCEQCLSFDGEYSNLELLYPGLYFYKVDIDAFDNWAEFSSKYNIQSVPTFSYFTNKIQFASFYAFSPVNKEMLDTLVEIHEEELSDEDEYDFPLDDDFELLDDVDCSYEARNTKEYSQSLLDDISKYINENFT